MSFLNHLLDAPLANILILAGLFFLGIGAVGKVAGKIEPDKIGRIMAGLLGLVLLIVGLSVHIQNDSSEKNASTQGPPPIQEATQTAEAPRPPQPAPVPKPAEGTVTPQPVPVPKPAEVPRPPRPSPMPKPAIESFVVSPTTVTRGGKVTISWKVSNADDVELQPFGQVSAVGSVFDQPKQTTLYKISATNKVGSDGAIQEVIVNDPAPEPTGPVNRPAGAIPNLAGTWAEINPQDPAHPLRMKVVQSGAQITAYMSYTQVFGNALLTANIIEGRAIQSRPQGCAPQFQKPGYNYDNPGVNTLYLGLRGPSLVYEQITRWTSPCDGHPIGIERNTKELQRLSLQ